MNNSLERSESHNRGSKYVLDSRKRRVEVGLDVPSDVPIVLIRTTLPTRRPALATPVIPDTHRRQSDVASLVPVEHVGATIEASDTNTLSLLKSPDGQLFVKKRHNTESMYNHKTLIEHLSQVEYPAVGFTGSVRGRSFPEQAAFAERASKAGLPIEAALHADDETLIIPFIYGDTLRTRVELGDISVVTPALNSLSNSHEKGFILGDRWTMNMVVRNDGVVVPIDFEVALEGEHTAEFDMAQLVYSMTGQANLFEETLDEVGQFAGAHGEYDWERVLVFMQGYNNYLAKNPKGYVPRLGDKLSAVTRAILT